MCGIAGFCISDKDHRKIDSRNLASKLLLEIQQRGRHATGAVWTERDKEGTNFYYAKAPVAAAQFVKNGLAHMPRHSRTALLHTRYATLGTPKVEGNNHPIIVPGVVGVHNGHIANHRQIFADLQVPRIAEVDSEAIFQLIANSPNPVDQLGILQGTAAIGWCETDDPYTLHLARVTGSPLAVGTTMGGSTVFASTAGMLALACRMAGVTLLGVIELAERSYMRVERGKVVDRQTIHMADDDYEESEEDAIFRRLALGYR